MRRLAAFASVALASACGGFTAADPRDAGTSVEPTSDATVTEAGSDDAGRDDAMPPDAGRKLVAFVTSVGYAGVSTAIDADTKCNAEAAGRLPGRFVAWYSTPSAAAPSRLVDDAGAAVDGPWFRVDGARIAASRDALVRTATAPLEHAVDITVVGNKTTATSVWTATHADGGIGQPCSGTSPTKGSTGEVGPKWTDHAYFTANCSASLALYCFQVE